MHDHSADDASTQYDTWIKNHPAGTLWQSLERKEYLQALGKDVWICIGKKDGNTITSSGLVVVDKTAFGLSTWDIPRGPIGDGADDMVKGICAQAKKQGALSLTFSPLTEIKISGAKNSGAHIHAEATRIIDLTKSEEEILAQMKPKGRYNIKVAERHGVTVEQSDDIDAFFALEKATAKRDGFTAHGKAHYQTFLDNMPGSFLMLAYDMAKKPIAGLIGVIWNGQGIYYYGASDSASKALMAPYLLQWEAMRSCKASGCVSYDLLGVAPPDAANHPWQGISAFKEKFGGSIVIYPPEQIIVLRPLPYYALKLKRAFLG